MYSVLFCFLFSCSDPKEFWVYFQTEAKMLGLTRYLLYVDLH